MVENTELSPENSNEKSIEKNANLITTEGPKVFSVEILHLIRDAQQQHGLRHGDYQRYRGYCSRRVERLRKALKLPQGEKRHFKRRDVTIVHLTGKNADVRYIHIPLILAERAWSFAMQLRQESNTEQRKKFHLIAKLRKACGYALQVQELCNSDLCDARTKLEAEAYVAWMYGTLHFELSLWKTAAESLKKAQVIYENLVQALPEEEQAVYRAKVEELTPSLRYCAYNIGDGTSIDDLVKMRAEGLLENLDELVTQTKTQSSEALQTTEWRGRKVTVRPEKVRLFLISIQEVDKSLATAKDEEAKIQLIENLLMDCKDAIQAVRDELKQDPKLRTVVQGQNISGMQYLLAYLSYIRLIRTIERNLCLVAQAKVNLDNPNQKDKRIEGKKVRPQDLTRFYEIIVQNITELQQISGLEEDAAYQAEVEALSIGFKAFRCYYIALTLVAFKRWKEAVALYERSKNYAHEAIKAKIAQFNLQSDLTKLIDTIDASKCVAHAYSVLEESQDTVTTSKSTKSVKPLFERLNEYREDSTILSNNPNVFKLTPDMQPIPVKPIFFDLALNYIQFPNLDDKVDDGTAGHQKPAGISGFVKGFLGWGGGQK